MSTLENKNFRVLVTSGNQGLLDAGKEPYELNVGQVGVFSTSDGKAISEIDDSVKEFYFAVKDPDGKLTYGDFIQKNHIIYNHKIEPADPQNQIVKITDYKLNGCDQVYTVAFSVSNTVLYRANFAPWNKVFSVIVGCPGCTDENPNKLTKALMEAINNDNEGILHAKAVKRSDGSDISDIDAFIEQTEGADYNDENNLSDVVVEVDSTALYAMCNGLSNNYAHPRVTYVQVGLRDGFTCDNGKVEEVQAPKPAIGNGYDIQHLEMIASGWNDKSGVYRFSNYAPLPLIERDMAADKDTKYVQYVIGFDTVTGNFVEPTHHYKDLIIAVPVSDTTTTGALDTLLGYAAEESEG